MRSSTPKVLHPIGGRSLLAHALASARSLDPAHLVVVVRHERDRVAEHVAQVAPDALIADQDEIKGTGRAVACGLEGLPKDLAGTVVVTYGDVPLLAPATLADLVATHTARGGAVTVLTAEVPDPTGYGRVVRDPAGDVLGIVEHKDADAATLAVREINSGIYAFDAAVLRDCLARLSPDNAQGEMYLTDVLTLAREAGGVVSAHPTTDLWQVEGVNDRVQLAALGAELNRRLLLAWMRAGVTVVDPASTWVGTEVVLEPDVTLLPGVQLHGATTVAAGATIGPDSTLTDCEVGPGASVVRTHGSGASVAAGATVGPFSFLRPGTVLGPAGQDRGLRGDEERGDRRGLEGPAPVLRRRRHDRGAQQHRGGDRRRQLRRRGQAPHHGRRPRPGRQRHDAGRAGDDRRRRLHRGRFGDHRGRPGRGAGGGPGPAAQRRAGWVERRRPGTPSARAAAKVRQEVTGESSPGQGEETGQE